MGVVPINAVPVMTKLEFSEVTMKEISFESETQAIVDLRR